MNNSNSSKQILLSVIGVAILVVAVVGVSFAFFNYTRTGSVNTVKTGQIFFEQTHSSVVLNDVFPVSASDVNDVTTSDSTAQTGYNANVSYVEVTVHGYTTYTNGVDFTISADDVDVTAGTGANSRTVPVSVSVSCSSDFNTTDATCEPTSYGPGQSSSLATGTRAVLATGKIKPSTVNAQTGELSNDFTGKIIIKTYLDSSRIAITDTSTREGDPHLEGDTTVGNGTTNEDWIHDRTVLTTAQWNDLSTNPISFKIRVEANEGA